MDKVTKDFTINAGLLGALGAIWQGKPTRISPLRYDNGKAHGQEEKARLVAAGVCDANGEPVPGIRPALDILGNAEAFTRMYISSGLNVYEYMVYFSGDGKAASMINVQGDFQINYPSIAGQFVEMATQTIGSTVYKSATMDANLTPEEALVLAAIIDLQRQAFLKALASSKESAIVEPTPSDIGTILSAKEKNYQWLNNVIREIAGPSDLSSEDKIIAALKSSAQKGLLIHNGAAGYRLSDNVLILARRMLVLDSSIVLTSGHLRPEGAVSVAGFTCLQAGVHDLLYIDANVGVINLKAISSDAVLNYIKAFMTDLSALKQIDAPSPSSQQPATGIPGKKFCPQCGAPVKEGKKFCSSCGATVN